MNYQTPLNKVRASGSARSGTHHWWQQRLTAITNIPLVAFFVIIVLSLIGADHATVAARLGSPFVAIAMVAMILSLAWHMRLGMQVIIEDYVHATAARTVLLIANWFFTGGVALAALFALLKLSLGA